MSDRFFVPGRVNPSEYNWEEQFSKVAKDFLKSPVAFVPMDVGKVMGVCAELKVKENENASLKKEYKEMFDSVADKDRVFCETLMQNKALKAEVERRKEQIMEYNESPDPDHYKRQTLHLREENVALEMKLIEFEKEKAWLRKKLGRASEHITELVVHCIRARDIMKEGTDTWRPWI